METEALLHFDSIFFWASNFWRFCQLNLVEIVCGGSFGGCNAKGLPHAGVVNCQLIYRVLSQPGAVDKVLLFSIL